MMATTTDGRRRRSTTTTTVLMMMMTDDVYWCSDQSSSLERLRLECLDIRSQVEQSTTHVDSHDDAHGGLSDVGSEEDTAGPSVDSSGSHCLIDVTQTAPDTPSSQQG